MNAALAALLERPDIWRGDASTVAPAPSFPSGFAALDAELPGQGWPRGQLTELLCAAQGIGEISLLLPALARMTANDQRVVMVMRPGERRQAHAPGWAAAGIKLSQLIVLHPANARDALWASVESLRCHAVAATVCWPDAAVLRRGRPVDALSNSLRRLQTAVAEGGGCGFMIRPLACAVQTSPAPLRLTLVPQDLHLQLELIKRRGAPATRPLTLAVSRPVSLGRRSVDALARSFARCPESRLATV